MASFSSPSSTQLRSFSSSIKPYFTTTRTAHFQSFTSKKIQPLVISATLSDNGAGSVQAPVPAAATASAVTLEVPPPAAAAVMVEEKPVIPVVEGNGAASGGGKEAGEAVAEEGSVKFENPKWVNGTWDLTQFQKDGKPDWDAVIDAEVRRRKWLEDNPESSNNDFPVSFDTSIIPWWAWMKRFHLPEAELLNGRAAMVGFFMAYFVDSLTGVGLVDQMGNFFCKTLLFIAVAGVLLIRKNEDLDNLKKLIDETTFYDRQWQATWQDETTGKSKKD